MVQTGKFITLAVIGAVTVIALTGIFSFTATQFSSSDNSFQLDVDVKPNNLKMRAAVNNKDKQPQKPNGLD